MTPEDMEEVEKIVFWGRTPLATFCLLIGLGVFLMVQISIQQKHITALELQVKELKEHKP